MPRIKPFVCSGICLLLTTTLYAQAPLPKHPTAQQVAGYTLQQQRAWAHRQLPANSVLFKSNANYAASHAFLQNRSLMDLPAYEIPYGFTIRQSYALYPDYKEALTKDDPYELLKVYLARDRIYYGEKQRSAWLYEPDGLGSLLLSNLVRRYTPPPPGLSAIR
jgi:hypothetical protein